MSGENLIITESDKWCGHLDCPLPEYARALLSENCSGPVPEQIPVTEKTGDQVRRYYMDGPFKICPLLPKLRKRSYRDSIG